jgi:Concanavalin A-like lectin/glucanases superfamily/Bacterial Ig domain
MTKRWHDLICVLLVLAVTAVLSHAVWPSGAAADPQVREYVYAGRRLIVSIGPAATPTPAPVDHPPIGYHDVPTCSGFAGWTCDPDKYAAALAVQIFVDGASIGNTTANAPRGDITSSCQGDPNHGFTLSVPNLFKDGRSHVVSAKATSVDQTSAPRDAYLLYTPPGAPSWSFTCADTLPPTVSFTAPANGATVSGVVPITGAAADNASVTRVELYLDGTLKATLPATWSSSWPTEGYANGTHTLMAKAYDAANNAATASITVTVSNATPMAHWKLDETSGLVASDASGGGNNGTLVNGPTWSAGVIAGGLAFGGGASAPYVSVPASPFLEGMAALSVSTWIKLSQLPPVGSYYVPIGKDNGGFSYRLLVDSNGGGHFAVATTANAGYTAGTTASFSGVQPNTWYHLVGTYDGTRVRAYVNGRLSGTGASAISGAIAASTSPLYFGFRPAANIAAFAGTLDDVRLYRRTLSAAEVQALYLVLDRSSLNAVAVKNGATLTAVTPPQTIGLTVAPGTSWTATSSQPFVTVTPASGTGSAALSIQVVANGLPASGNTQAVITVNGASPGATPETLVVRVSILTGATNPPFGFLETPANNTANVHGEVAVTGWALDDVGVTKVQIFRDPIPGESPGSNGKVYIGDAAFVQGVRPDVLAIYPTLPMADRAGWGYSLLTLFLPPNGNGAFTLYAYALDAENKSTLLGSTSFTVNNAASPYPFGTIDTPTSGQTVSGSVANFGWALTPQPATILSNGVVVFIDGVPAGNAQYGMARSDIAALFPGYTNSSAAVGLFTVDTSTLVNGLHTIAWSVTDSQGHAAGVGSRYFWVLN